MNLIVVFVGPPSPLEHLVYWCMIASIAAMLVCALVSNRDNKHRWLWSDAWNRAHYKGAGTSEYDQARRGDIDPAGSS